MSKFNPFQWISEFIDRKIEHIPDNQAQAFSDKFQKDFQKELRNEAKIIPLIGTFRMTIDEGRNIQYFINETPLIMYPMVTMEYRRLAQKNGHSVIAKGVWEKEKFKVLEVLKFF